MTTNHEPYGERYRPFRSHVFSGKQPRWPGGQIRFFFLERGKARVKLFAGACWELGRIYHALRLAFYHEMTLSGAHPMFPET